MFKFTSITYENAIMALTDKDFHLARDIAVSAINSAISNKP